MAYDNETKKDKESHPSQQRTSRAAPTNTAEINVNIRSHPSQQNVDLLKSMGYSGDHMPSDTPIPGAGEHRFERRKSVAT